MKIPTPEQVAKEAKEEAANRVHYTLIRMLSPNGAKLKCSHQEALCFVQLRANEWALAGWNVESAGGGISVKPMPGEPQGGDDG